MEKLEKFLESFLKNASFLRIFIVTATLVFVVFAPLIYLLSSSKIDVETRVKISLFVGMFSAIFSGLLISLSMSILKKSMKFWEYAKHVEQLINHSKTNEELRSVCENQFEELKKMSIGRHHVIELTRLYTMIDIKRRM